MKTVIQLKRSIVDTSTLCMVIGKLYHEQQLSLIILIIVDKGPKIGFYSLILPFYLSICLKVEGGRESSIDV